MSARTSWSVHEERLGFDTTIPGESLDRLIRADMTFIEKQDGGAVFSTGSITYCGSLPVNGFRQRRVAAHLQRAEQVRRARLSWPL